MTDSEAGLTDSEGELADDEAEPTDSEAELTDRESELTDSEAELADNEAGLTDSEAELTDSESELTDSEAELTDSEAELADNEAGLTDSEGGLADDEAELTDSETELADNEAGLTDSEGELADDEAELADSESKLTDSEAELADSLAETVLPLLHLQHDKVIPDSAENEAELADSLAETVIPLLHLQHNKLIPDSAENKAELADSLAETVLPLLHLQHDKAIPDSAENKTGLAVSQTGTVLPLLHLQHDKVIPDSAENEAELADSLAETVLPLPHLQHNKLIPDSAENEAELVDSLAETVLPLPHLQHDKVIPDSASSDRHAPLQSLIEIEYNDTDISEISSKDYVYCGSAKNLPVNNLVMTIDNDGHLRLIRGKKYDLFKGLFKKIFFAYKYETAKLVDNKHDIKFEKLYIDDNGLLIGIEKDTGKSYNITISTPKDNKNSSKQLLTLELLDYDKKDSMTFEIDKNVFVTYHLENNILYRISSQEGNKKKEVSLSLSSDCKIMSIKREMGDLQIEIHNGNKDKRRIFFIHPSHSLTAEISHKPPQNILTRTGGDPHETYHAGFPFASDRKGNFNSESIPFFSFTVGNFRIYIKEFKSSLKKGEKKTAITNLSKAIDPGIRGGRSVLSWLTGAAIIRYSNKINNKDELYDYNINILRKDAKLLSKVIDAALGEKSHSNFEKSLSNVFKQMASGDKIQLENADFFSVFFGFAYGGIPFNPGWFAGAIASATEKHNVTIEKITEDTARISFNNQFKTTAVAIAGTGQGLEYMIYKTANIDLLAAMAEANFIIAVKDIGEYDFTFKSSENTIIDFATQVSQSKKDTELKKHIISQSEAKKIKDKEATVKFEAKAESRLQIGTMADDNTYILIPRTAVGASLATTLLNVKKNTSKTLPESGNTASSGSSEVEITAGKSEAEIYHARTVLPIHISSGSDEINKCIPLTLTEEKESVYKYEENGYDILNKKTGPDSKLTGTDNGISVTKNIKNFKEFEMVITAGKEKRGKYKTIMQNELAKEKLSEVVKFLSRMKSKNGDKSCKIDVIAHYKSVNNESQSTEQQTVTPSGSMDTTPSADAARSTSHTALYRLERLEFRRISSLSIQKGTIPLVIFTLLNKTTITCDHYLGDVVFSYNSAGVTELVSVINNLDVLY